MGCCWLVTVLCLLFPTFGDLNLYQGTGNLQSEKIFNSCFFWADSKNPDLLSLAQHWEKPNPFETFELRLRKSDSFQSEFDLRTYDPEGVVFYGDTKEKDNWFILALRNGRPEIQFSSKYARLAVSSGDILNDGKWWKILVRSKGNQIFLSINQKPSLTFTVLPGVGLDSNLINMRIAIGGLLINESSLLLPLKHPLDGCVASWNWLQKNTTWLERKVARNPNLQCPTNIVPGSFFPGVGMAVFKTSDFLNASASQVNWSLRFEAVIRPKKHSGVVMAIMSGTHDPLVKLQFSRHNRREKFQLDLGAMTLISLPGPPKLCDGVRVAMTITESEATFQIGTQEVAHAVSAEAFTPLVTSWFNRDAMLVLGGLPDVEKLGHDWHLFSGCMQAIRLQGLSVDFNHAWFKHDAISSHSCPASK
uniref:sex hormone-binding globulin n=1 Tax=Pristiophorus japonicus TaxID=55135 RepID=UPI00398F8186